MVITKNADGTTSYSGPEIDIVNAFVDHLNIT